MTPEQIEAIWGDRAPFVRLLARGDDRVWVDRDSDAERCYREAGWGDSPAVAAPAVAEPVAAEAVPAAGPPVKRGPGRPPKVR